MSSDLKTTDGDLVAAEHSVSDVTGPYQVFFRPRPARLRPTTIRKTTKTFMLLIFFEKKLSLPRKIIHFSVRRRLERD